MKESRGMKDGRNGERKGEEKGNRGGKNQLRGGERRMQRPWFAFTALVFIFFLNFSVHGIYFFFTFIIAVIFKISSHQLLYSLRLLILLFIIIFSFCITYIRKAFSRRCIFFYV